MHTSNQSNRLSSRLYPTGPKTRYIYNEYSCSSPRNSPKGRGLWAD